MRFSDELMGSFSEQTDLLIYKQSLYGLLTHLFCFYSGREKVIASFFTSPTSQHSFNGQRPVIHITAAFLITKHLIVVNVCNKQSHNSITTPTIRATIHVPTNASLLRITLISMHGITHASLLSYVYVIIVPFSCVSQFAVISRKSSFLRCYSSLTPILYD